MEKINSLSLPATILLASLILGGSYYLVETNKQKSIERQQEVKIAEENRRQQEESLQKSLCADEAERNAINSNKKSCDSGGYCVDREGGYLVKVYENYYDICLQSKGIK